jgi:gas vesicle protein
MKPAQKIKLVALATAVMLVFSGCELIDQIKGDFLKSAQNVKKKTEEVKKSIDQTRESIDRKIKKTENLIDAVNDLQSEFKK